MDVESGWKLFCLCFLLSGFNKPSLAANEEVTLQTYLTALSNSIYARPVSDPNSVLQLNITFFLEKIIHLNGNEQTLTITGLLFVMWRDSRMKWNKSSYANATRTHMGVSKIWTPTFYVANGAGENQRIIADPEVDQVSLRYDGIVYYQKKVRLEVSCELDVRKFPEDTQYCAVKINIEGYINTEIKIETEHKYGSRDFYFKSREWNITKWRNKVNIVSFNPSKDNKVALRVPQYVYEMWIKRSPEYYKSTVVYPMLMLSLLLVLCFFLPVESGEKISLGITVLLSFTIFLLVMDNLMPKTNQLPYLNSYILGLLGIATVTIVISAIVLRVYHIDHKVQRMHPRLFDFLIRGVGTMVLYFGCRAPPRRRPDKPKKNQVRDRYSSSSDSYMSDSDDAKTKRRPNGTPSPKRPTPTPTRTKNYQHNRNKAQPPKKSTAFETEKKPEFSFKIRDEWKIAAAILDRVFMIIGVIILFVVSLMYLQIFPNMHASTTIPDN